MFGTGAMLLRVKSSVFEANINAMVTGRCNAFLVVRIGRLGPPKSGVVRRCQRPHHLCVQHHVHVLRRCDCRHAQRLHRPFDTQHVVDKDARQQAVNVRVKRQQFFQLIQSDRCTFRRTHAAVPKRAYGTCGCGYLCVRREHWFGENYSRPACRACARRSQ